MSSDHEIIFEAIKDGGLSSAQKEQTLSQLEFMRLVLSRSPKDTDAINYYGHLLSSLGRDTEAIEIYNRGLKIKPKDIELINNKG